MPLAVSFAAGGDNIQSEFAEHVNGAGGLRGEEHFAPCRLRGDFAYDIGHRAEAVRNGTAELVCLLRRASRCDAARKNSVEAFGYSVRLRTFGAELRAQFLRSYMIFLAQYFYRVRKSSLSELFSLSGALPAPGADALLDPRGHYLRPVRAHGVYSLARPFDASPYALERTLRVVEAATQLPSLAVGRIFLRGAQLFPQLFEPCTRYEHENQSRRRALGNSRHRLRARGDDRAYSADADKCRRNTELTEFREQPGTESRSRVYGAQSGLTASRRECRARADSAYCAARFTQGEAQQHDGESRRSPGGTEVQYIEPGEGGQRRAAGNGDADYIVPAESV